MGFIEDFSSLGVALRESLCPGLPIDVVRMIHGYCLLNCYARWLMVYYAGTKIKYIKKKKLERDILTRLYNFFDEIGNRERGRYKAKMSSEEIFIRFYYEELEKEEESHSYYVLSLTLPLYNSIAELVVFDDHTRDMIQKYSEEFDRDFFVVMDYIAMDNHLPTQHTIRERLKAERNRKKEKNII